MIALGDISPPTLGELAKPLLTVACARTEVVLGVSQLRCLGHARDLPAAFTL